MAFGERAKKPLGMVRIGDKIKLTGYFMNCSWHDATGRHRTKEFIIQKWEKINEDNYPNYKPYPS